MRVGKPAARVAVVRVDSAARSAAATVREASAADAGAVVRFLRVFADNLATGTGTAVVDPRTPGRGPRAPRSPR
jgi:hypothetical protein